MTVVVLLAKLKKAFPNINWSIPSDLKFGVLTTNYAFIEAKKQSTNPVEFAAKLSHQINTWATENRIQITTKNTGPYINLQLTTLGFEAYFADINTFELEKSQQQILLEFISPNVGKPLHVGHILQGNYGQALHNIFNLKYKSVITDIFWCDWGVPMGIMLWAYKTIGDKTVNVHIQGKEESFSLLDLEKKPMDTLIKIYVWGNKQKELVENWDNLVRTEMVLLTKGDTQNQDLIDKFVEISKSNTRELLNKLNIQNFDHEYGEAFYEKMTNKMLDFLKTKSWVIPDNKGFYVNFELLAETLNEGDLQTKNKIANLGRCYLVQSSDGYTSYALRDITARFHWASHFKADKMITLVGSEQKHHFDQFFTIIKTISTDPQFQEHVGKETALKMANVEVLLNGLVKLEEGRMSARKGNFVTALEILDQVQNKAQEVLLSQDSNQQVDLSSQEKVRKIAVAAMKWFNLNRDIVGDSILDINSILKFEGNTGVYQLYTIARLQSILEKNPANNLDKATFDLSKLNSVEMEIVTQTFVLPLILENISQNFKPHLLCTYLFELASKINSWYGNHSLLEEKDPVRKQTLIIFCQQLKQHLWGNLELLGVEPVERL
jgi:arginyl-tRNA synthetase